MPELERFELRELESGWQIFFVYADGSEKPRYRTQTREEGERFLERLNGILARVKGVHRDPVVVPRPES